MSCDSIHVANVTLEPNGSLTTTPIAGHVLTPDEQESVDAFEQLRTVPLCRSVPTVSDAQPKFGL